MSLLLFGCLKTLLVFNANPSWFTHSGTSLYQTPLYGCQWERYQRCFPVAFPIFTLYSKHTWHVRHLKAYLWRIGGKYLLTGVESRERDVSYYVWRVGIFSSSCYVFNLQSFRPYDSLKTLMLVFSFLMLINITSDRKQLFNLIFCTALYAGQCSHKKQACSPQK